MQLAEQDIYEAASTIELGGGKKFILEDTVGQIKEKGYN